MKIRSGFVSNSSSSSFVIIGFQIDTPKGDALDEMICKLAGITMEEFKSKEYPEDFVYNFLAECYKEGGKHYTVLNCIEDGKSVVGVKFITGYDDSGIDDKKRDLAKIMTQVFVMAEKLGIENQPKIDVYSGTE